MVVTARHITLAPATPITTAITGAVIGGPFTGLAGVREMMLEGKFTYGSGGTTAKFWLQTSLDGGTTWFDVASFAFTTATANKVSAIVDNPATPLPPGTTPGSAALADNTVLNGAIGDRFRVIGTTTGTYAGGTSFELHAVTKG